MPKLRREISNILTLHFKKKKKKEQAKLKVDRTKEMIKIRAEINVIGN